MEKSISMKILIVNAEDIRGGAARAAYRLHKALIEANIDSKMLVQRKTSDDFTIIGFQTKMEKILAIIRPIINQIPVLFYKSRTKTLFSPAKIPFSNIANKINKINPDIVHLHWINAGMINIEEVAKIKAPIVWSLHDNWAFTGGCHIMWECERYKEQCGSCPRLGSSKENDLSRKVFQRKQKTFSYINNITILGLSRWIERCAKESTLLKNKKIINLPNLIDTNIYKPIEKKIAREILSLPIDKKLILFGAVNATGDINKGFNELTEAIKKLQSKDIEFIVFGSSEPNNAPDFKYNTHYIGHLNDDISLKVLYSACDVMIVPSLQENLSNAIMESLSCSTPVVAFDVGGNRDLIEHQKNGYLAKAFDTNDLAYGIEWIINHPSYNKLCLNTRETILKNFESSIVVNRYINVYEKILNDNKINKDINYES